MPSLINRGLMPSFLGTSLTTSLPNRTVMTTDYIKVGAEGIQNCHDASSDLLCVCPRETMDTCYKESALKYVIVSLSLLSFIGTIFHLLVLRRVTSLYGSSYLFVLKQITAAEIYAFVHVLTVSCPFHQLYLGKDKRIAAAIAAVNGHSGIMRLCALTVASLERYFSICQPLSTATATTWSRIRSIKLISAVLWILSLAVVTAKCFVFIKNLCLWPLFGPSTSSINASEGGFIIIAYFATLTIIMFYCQVKVLRTLKQSDDRVRRSNSSHKNQYARQAAYYIIAINVVHLVCLWPSLMAASLVSFGISVSEARWALKVLMTLPGILQVIIFGGMTKNYRLHALKIFNHSNKTEPPTLKGKLRGVSGRLQRYNFAVGQTNRQPVAVTDVSVFIVSYRQSANNNIEETSL